MNYVYILKCADNSLYTGYTNNIPNRLKTHNLGKGAKYTRARLPVTLIYFEQYESNVEAQKREFYIKKHLKRAQKQELIDSAQIGYKCITKDKITYAQIGGELIEITNLQ
ncbi:MAG: GIY-YIG nuclease family protein [Clostridia bacterium]|nr:GIY-YIG nuclease family protein [Clostridia bacterium]